MGRRELVKAIENFVTKLKEDFNIKRVIFFGSRAIGKARKDSDIDLIIVSNDFEGMSFFERGAKMYDYWTEEIPVDFLCFTEKEFNKLKNRISIVSEALTYGLPII